MKNRTVVALPVTALLTYAAVAIISSARELKLATEMTETLRREIEAAEIENRELREKLGEINRKDTMNTDAEEPVSDAVSQQIIFIDKG